MADYMGNSPENNGGSYSYYDQNGNNAGNYNYGPENGNINYSMPNGNPAQSYQYNGGNSSFSNSSVLIRFSSAMARSPLGSSTVS